MKKIILLLVLLFIPLTANANTLEPNCKAGKSLLISTIDNEARYGGLFVVNGQGSVSNVRYRYISKNGEGEADGTTDWGVNLPGNFFISKNFEYTEFEFYCVTDTIINTIEVEGKIIYEYNPIYEIKISPASITLSEGEEAIFTANAHYADGTVKNVTNLATWSISNDNAIFVSNNSLLASFYMTVYAAENGMKIRSVKEGSVNVSASYGGVTGTAKLTVAPPASLKTKLRAFIDKIFNPIHTFLDLAKERLQQAGTVTAQGLNVGQYLSIFGDMPMPWQLVIYSLMISLALIGSIFMFRSIMRIYYALKDGVKWW